MFWLLACVGPAADSHATDSGDPVVDSGDSADPIDSIPTVETGDTAPAIDTGHADEPLPLCINEFMPDNASSAYDSQGLAEDWIELHNPGETDIDLAGWTLTDDSTNPNKSKLPGGILPAGGYALYWASGAEEEVDDQLSFRLTGEGGEIGVFAPDGRGSVVKYELVNPDFSVERTTNCCTGDGCLDFRFRGTPGVSNTPLVYDETDIVGAGSTWRYWADTSVAADWTTMGFADSAWIDGEAPLGYGSGETTTLPYGSDANNRWPTAWFRLYFEAADLDTYDTITLNLRRDDGAAVYLNGAELLRDNLAPGVLTPSTLARSATESGSTYFPFVLASGTLVEGPNQLAVEVHQATVDSADLVFDLSIIGSRLAD